MTRERYILIALAAAVVTFALRNPPALPDAPPTPDAPAPVSPGPAIPTQPVSFQELALLILHPTEAPAIEKAELLADGGWKTALAAGGGQWRAWDDQDPTDNAPPMFRELAALPRSTPSPLCIIANRGRAAAFPLPKTGPELAQLVRRFTEAAP